MANRSSDFRRPYTHSRAWSGSRYFAHGVASTVVPESRHGAMRHPDPRLAFTARVRLDP